MTLTLTLTLTLPTQRAPNVFADQFKQFYGRCNDPARVKP